MCDKTRAANIYTKQLLQFRGCRTLRFVCSARGTYCMHALSSTPLPPSVRLAASLLQELFPQFADMITDEAYERLALQKVSRLPAFSYTGPILHLGKSAVLLGERPFPGLGC